MKISKRVKSILACTLALLTVIFMVSVTGCSSTGTTPAPASSSSSAASASSSGAATASTVAEQPGSSVQQTVRMWTFLDPTKDDGRGKTLKAILDSFETANPNIKVVVEPQDYKTMTAKFLAGHNSGNAPDIIWGAQGEIGGVLDAGALEPFENLFLKNWTADEINDINDAQWSFAMRDGKHYQVTLSKNIIALYYRTDLFNKYGIAIPKTWDELVAIAQKLTGKDPDTGIMRYGLGQAFNTQNVDPQIMTNMILSQQGNLFTSDGKADWTGQTAQDALQWEIDSMKKWKITPETAVTASNEDLFLEFEAGKYAMIVGGAVRVPTIKAAATFDPNSIQLMLFPNKDGSANSPSMLTGWSVGVWSGSKVKEAAGKFIEAMISPESDALWVKVGGQAPVRKSTLTKEADFFSNPQNEYLKVMSKGFESGWMQPTDRKVAGWGVDMNQAIQNVMVNKMSIKDALAATAKQFDERNGN